jgi:hypothetical protein
MAVTTARIVPTLITAALKRASASRPSGEWRDEDYDVLADGVVDSRPRPIADARDGGASAGRSADRVSAHGRRRVRALNGRHRARRPAPGVKTHGDARTLDEAKAKFRAAWDQQGRNDRQ